MVGASVDPGGGEDRYLRLLNAIARTGRPGRELAVRLDLVRSLGLRQAWRRRREEARAAARPQGGIRPGYRRIWLDAAREVGAEPRELGDGFIEFHRGGRIARVWNSWVPLDDAVTLRFADDKLLARKRLIAAGLAVPDHMEFTLGDLGPAVDFLFRQGGPCVVKPVDSAGGSGATTGIRTAAGLRRGCLRAGRIGRRLVIEGQVPGDLYRLLFLDGEFLDAVRRMAPRVTGDGRSTVAELVEAENARRLAAAGGERTGLLRIDLDAILTLEQLGMRLDSVPAAGNRLAVKTVVNQNSRDDNTNVREQVCEALVEEAAAAVRAIGVRVAGVDLITPDPALSPSEAGGAILEVNGTPGLHYHYEVSNPDRRVPVAVPILERLLADSASGVRAAVGPQRTG